MDARFSAVFQKEETGYSALCPELDVASQGESIEEARTNLREAIELYLESAKELGILKDVLSDAGIDLAKKKAVSISFISPIEASLPA